MYIYNGMLLSYKKNEILLFAATWMDREIVTLSEISQRKTNTIYYLYMESKKIIQMNVYRKQKQTCRHRKQICGYTEGREGRRKKSGVWNEVQNM